MCLVRPDILPHRHSQEDPDKEFPVGAPQPEQYGEVDHTPEDELAGPVPAIREHQESVLAQRVSAVGAGATDSLFVLQEDCLSEFSLSAARAGSVTAQAVGFGGEVFKYETP